MKRHVASQDSLLSDEKIRAIAKLESKYLLEKQKKENELLAVESKLQKREIDSKKIERNGIIALSAILAITVLIVGAATRRLSVTNRILLQRNLLIEEQKEEIVGQNEELLMQQEEIKSQRDTLETQNRELAQSRRQISQHNLELEAAVSARTLELASSNDVLKTQFHQLEQFSFITAHNLRGPVARILGLANIFDRSKPEDNVEILDKLIATTKDLDSIIHDIGEILLASEGPKQKQEAIELLPFIEKIISSFSNEMQSIGGSFIIQIDALVIKTVPNYLSSILTNLISNSIKYCSPTVPLQIELSVMAEADRFNWIVRDNGLGFDFEKYATKVFEPFQRFHTQPEGKGLGLYLVKAHIKNLGGGPST
ncbi:MAG: ATP-binding protein [Flammeovirgaceae bacterium]|nr:ATP-binding protein [Flammeovirgaceae bacterium]